MGNLAVISGRIVRDAILKTSETGSMWVAFSVETDGPPTSKGKSRIYHRVVVYGNHDWLENWLMPRAQAERAVSVQGQIRNASIPTGEGNRVRLSEIFAQRNGIEFPDLEQAVDVTKPEAVR